MHLTEIELSELICAKFCHDLAGPIGAINNGIEFLKEENLMMQQKAQQLVIVSAAQAVARLQFYRQAYGVTQSIGEANLSELKLLIESYLAGSKTKFDWSEESILMSGLSISNNFAKLILNLIKLSNDILIYGGKIHLVLNKLEGGKQVKLKVKGNGIKLSPEYYNFLSNQSDEMVINTKNIHLYLIKILLKKFKVKLTIEKLEQQIDFVLDYFK